MIPLFGASDPNGARDVLEGRLIWVALAALRLGTSAVLDFGLWGRDERLAVRARAVAVLGALGGGAVAVAGGVALEVLEGLALGETTEFA